MKLGVRFRVLGGYLGIIVIFLAAILTTFLFQQKVNTGVDEIFQHTAIMNLALGWMMW